MAIQRDKIIASAEKLVAKGKVEAAIKEYDRLLDDNPNDVNTLNRIGDLWVRINRNDEAVKVFGRIADHYSRDGFFLKAIAIFKKINKLDPSKLDIYAKLADLYAKQGLAMEAKSQYQVLADFYLKHGDPANALATYRKISELDPNSINVHVKLADLYGQNNQTAEALKEYDRVGRMLLKRGMLDEAVQVFRKALKIDASNLELIESLVTALLDARDYNNATQILESSLEKNRDNPRLTALLGKAQLAGGNVDAARDTLERGLTANPTDNGVRESLADVYLRSGATDRALELINPVVDAALARNDGKTAVETLGRVLRVESTHIPTLTRLVAVYTRLREETNILSSMNNLAEAHIARRSFADAAGVLTELIKREPQNGQHREKLDFVRQQLGGAAPVAPPPTPTLPDIGFSEPSLDLGSIDMSGGEDLSIGLDDSPAIELDLSSDSMDSLPSLDIPAPTPRSIMAAAPPPPDLDDEGDNLDFITEHMTEAEVFAKYGLTEKAVEHLRAVLDRAPKHLPAYDKLLRVYMEEGDAPQIRQVADRYLNLLREKGEMSTHDRVRDELTSRGLLDSADLPSYDFSEPEMSTGAGLLDEAELSPAVEEMIQPDLSPAPEEELTIDLSADSGMEIEFDVEEPPSLDLPMTAAPAPVIEPEIEVEPLPEETFELPEPAAAEPAFDFGGDAFAVESTAAPIEEPAFGGFDNFGAAAAGPAMEELGEIDFYIGEGLLDEARSRLDALDVRFPGDAELSDRRARLREAEQSASAPAASVPDFGSSAAPQAFSAADIETELLSAIPEDDDIEIIAPAASTASSAPVADEASLFAEEDNFFDLAAELEDELEEELESVSLSEEEQSLEEIFKEFKKGVEQQLDSEDYDTHYNLGIAYKEMGLIDEAIGEFQLASKDPKRAIECCSMLGLCFLEKGMPQLAIKWYSKGLEVAEITEDEQLGLLYDLGSAYLEVGDVAQAQKAFIEIYGMRSSYRDVASRIKQLSEMTDGASGSLLST